MPRPVLLGTSEHPRSQLELRFFLRLPTLVTMVTMVTIDYGTYIYICSNYTSNMIVKDDVSSPQPLPIPASNFFCHSWSGLPSL